jgi:hypothetical protein
MNRTLTNNYVIHLSKRESNEKDDGSITRNSVVCGGGSLRHPNIRRQNGTSGMR